jgi:hypothetical protein
LDRNVLKWPRYYSISQVQIVSMANFTQDRISLEPCLGMEYQKGHTFLISLSQGIFHWPKINYISLVFFSSQAQGLVPWRGWGLRAGEGSTNLILCQPINTMYALNFQAPNLVIAHKNPIWNFRNLCLGWKPHAWIHMLGAFNSGLWKK